MRYVSVTQYSEPTEIPYSESIEVRHPESAARVEIPEQRLPTPAPAPSVQYVPAQAPVQEESSMMETIDSHFHMFRGLSSTSPYNFQQCSSSTIPVSLIGGR